jgi:hypothetical protein
LDNFAEFSAPNGDVEIGQWRIRINFMNPEGGGRVSAFLEVFNFVADDYRCEKNGSWNDDGKSVAAGVVAEVVTGKVVGS